MQKHPDADAFMRAYLEQPTDAVSRLVFADWLEETGEPHNAAWAHYIRLKIEADRHAPASYKRRELNQKADEYAPYIRAKLTISAKLFIGYPKSLLQLLPGPNITVRLDGFRVPGPALELVPESVARENLILPLDSQGRTLIMAATDPRNSDTAQTLEFILNRDIVLVRGECDEILARIHCHYSASELVSFESAPSLVEFVDTAVDAAPAFASPGGPIELADRQTVRFVSLLFHEAVDRRADRILISAAPSGLFVRYRIDNGWYHFGWVPQRLVRQTLTWLAIMARIPVEWTLAKPPSLNPMTGEFPIHVLDIRFRVRVTIQPSPDGPTIQIDLIRESPSIDL